ncbi:MAG: 3-hydroxyisobutyrate dehydrogenase [Planktomarina sp.]
MKIGFIGLGNMGAPMAHSLQTAGHKVLCFDPIAKPDGLSLGASITDAIAHIVVMMLPNGDIARSVAAEILPFMAKGSTLIDCSTIDVASARYIASLAMSHNVHSLDAPVSGGVGGAEAGTLTFMVGGVEAVYENAKPIFDIMGQKSVYCGGFGSGQAAKICNNMILGATMIATCEAFGLADKLGLDRQAMYDVTSTSSGQSWSMTTYCPATGIGPNSPADNNYTPGFSADLMLKDLKLALDAAIKAGADTPMAAKAAQLYDNFVNAGSGSGKDFSAILKTFT